MTVDELTAAGEQAGHVLPAGVLSALAKAEARASALLEMNFMPDVRVAKWKDHESTTRREVTAALDAAIAADDVLRRLNGDRQRVIAEARGSVLSDDEEAGAALVAGGGAGSAVADLIRQKQAAKVGAEGPVYLAAVQTLTSPNALLTLFRECLLGASPMVVRVVGMAIEERLHAAERSGAPGASSVGAAFRQAWGGWKQNHPSPVERLDTINNELQAREDQIRRGVAWATRAAGTGKPQLVA